MARWRSYGWDHGFDVYARRPSLTDGSREVKRALAALGKGVTPEPIRVEGRKMARSFWGQAWCQNLEAYSDFSNRLPRGRTYLRGGHVLHLHVGSGTAEAIVRGTSVYSIQIRISELSKARWKEITEACAGRIDSLVDLLAGRLSGPVMEVVTRKETGLFPAPREIQMTCSCPDWAGLCKHLAAVLYGIGARLDEEPQLLFTLRRVDAGELVAKVASAGAASLVAGPASGGGAAGSSPANALDLSLEGLASLFGIELAEPGGPRGASSGAGGGTPSTSRRRPAKPRTPASPRKPSGASGSRGPGRTPRRR